MSLHSEKKVKNWTNSSGKGSLPPDFYAEKYSYMLEVMRTDDYIAGPNSPNALESRFVEKINDMRREKGLTSIKEANIQMFVVPDMSKASANSYSTYVENFNRIVKKHVEKISKYRENHPGYKLGFLILDEAPGYIQVHDTSIDYKNSKSVKGVPHNFFKDANLVRSFMNVDLDFVLWIAPYKFFPPNKRMFPVISVYDLKQRNYWKNQLVEYNCDKMICLERW